jgi:hypothetical protein
MKEIRYPKIIIRPLEAGRRDRYAVLKFRKNTKNLGSGTFQISETSNESKWNIRFQYFDFLNLVRTHHAIRHNTPIHNILSTTPQLSISQEALRNLPEDGNVMPNHVGATTHD